MCAKKRSRESQRNRQFLEENEALNLPRQRSGVARTSKRALERAIVYDSEITGRGHNTICRRVLLECSLPMASALGGRESRRELDGGRAGGSWIEGERAEGEGGAVHVD